MPPGMGQGGMGPSRGPATGRGGTGRPIVAPIPPAKKGEELKIDSETLPPGFNPPVEKDPVMEIDKPLMMPDEIKSLSKDLPKYQSSVRAGRYGDADKELIRNGIRVRLAKMCLKENRAQLSALHEEFLREIRSAASVPDNPKMIKDFRQFFLTEFLNQATPLLETQNFYVRLHIAILIGQLDLTEDLPQYNTKQEAFVPSYIPLVKVLNDPGQHEAIKVAAANGLLRILRQGNPDVKVRVQIAQGLISELKNKKSHPWYQMRLTGALGFVDVDLDTQRQPFIVNMLKQILADDDRSWQVRAEAAYALGRVPLNPACNPPSIPREIGAFTLKLAKEAQQDPPKNERDPKWRAEFIKVYLAFQQKDKDDLMADKRTKAGLLNNQAASARSVYDLIVPMCAAVFHGQRLTVQQVQALQAHVGAAPAGNAENLPAPQVNDPSKSSNNSATFTGANGNK